MKDAYCPVVAEIAGKVYFFIVRLSRAQKKDLVSNRQAAEVHVSRVAQQIAERVRDIFPDGSTATPFLSLLMTVRAVVIARTTPAADEHLQRIVQTAGEENLKNFLLEIS